MCPRPSTTFVKRQKERARQEKQRAKAERKQQRKAEKLAGLPPEALPYNTPAMPPEERRGDKESS